VILVIVGAVLILIVAALLILGRGEEENTEEWDQYLDDELEGMERLFSGPARRISGSKLVKGVSPESLDVLNGRLKLGGAFGGSLNIFLAYQVTVTIIAAGLLAIAVLGGIPTFFTFVVGGLALTIVAWPQSHAKSAAKQRANDIRRYLPDFAELLLMVLPSMSVPQALGFTANKLDGPVAAEMRELVRSLTLRTMPEEQAFELTTRRLNTLEGRQFVSALKVAYLDGAKAVDPIRSQVDQLRSLQYQYQRAEAKKLPVKMVVSFAIHFMPLLFILAFLPVIFGLTGAK
jgi:pilus assembly protein TadC